jgi:CheY-like chemotaxis protein
MPGGSGWKVLDLFKNDLRHRHIPVYIISGEENSSLAFNRGARAFLLKPIKNEVLDYLFKDISSFISKTTKNLLLVEDNSAQIESIVSLFSSFANVEVTVAHNIEEAIQKLGEIEFDTIILDYSVSELSDNEILKKLQSSTSINSIPLILFLEEEFLAVEMKEFRKMANSVVLKVNGSNEKLMEETIFHLHLPHTNLPSGIKESIERQRVSEDILKGKNILVVDDDVRNLFALTIVFEKLEINVLSAESGMQAIEVLNETKDIDLILMDIMMPEMDGYETIRKIRRENSNINLPIIAVTAKAMKGDRKKCIEAGASDYITKPVKTDQLLALMRIWLNK